MVTLGVIPGSVNNAPSCRSKPPTHEDLTLDQPATYTDSFITSTPMHIEDLLENFRDSPA